MLAHLLEMERQKAAPVEASRSAIEEDDSRRCLLAEAEDACELTDAAEPEEEAVQRISTAPDAVSV